MDALRVRPRHDVEFIFCAIWRGFPLLSSANTNRISFFYLPFVLLLDTHHASLSRHPVSLLCNDSTMFYAVFETAKVLYSALISRILSLSTLASFFFGGIISYVIYLGCLLDWKEYFA
jgi:hypothetical protein